MKKIVAFMIDAAILLMGTAISMVGASFVVNDVKTARDERKNLPAPQPEAPAVEEAQNAEEPAAE